MKAEIRKDGLLYIDGEPVEQKRAHARNYSRRRMEPTLHALHDTASWLKISSVVSWFRNPKARVSAHFVVGLGGKIVQMVPCDEVAFHAGRSSWRGRNSCNGFAIGTELISPGKLRSVGKYAAAWFGGKWPKSELLQVDSKAHGRHGWWYRYPDDQIKAVLLINEAIARSIDTVKDVVGHYEISPGRKVDVGPHFPMKLVREAFAKASGHKHHPDVTIVRIAKERLIELGYHLGQMDDDVGFHTRNAIRGFQEQNSLTVTGYLDSSTYNLIRSVDAKPAPSGGRSETTTDDMALKGSRTIKTSTLAKRAVEIQAAERVFDAATSLPASEAIDHVEKGVATAEKAQGLFSRLDTILDWLTTPAGLKFALTILVLAGIWFGLHKIKTWRAQDHRDLKHIGR